MGGILNSMQSSAKSSAQSVSGSLGFGIRSRVVVVVPLLCHEFCVFLPGLPESLVLVSIRQVGDAEMLLWAYVGWRHPDGLVLRHSWKGLVLILLPA